MKKGILTILLLSFLLTIPSVSALAKEGGDSDNDNRGSGKFEVKDEKPEFDEDDIDELEDEDDEDEFEIEIEDVDEGGEFEIAGTISSISGNAFAVGGETITIDISKVAKFEQKGILAVGNSVKVEGIIVGGQKFAQEIKVFGMGGKNVKIEIKTAPAEVKIEAKGPIDQVINFLKQIFGF